MCKSMLVTLPLVLLLLDYWPLGRLSGVKCQVPGEKQGKPSTLNSQLSTLLLEKLPLLGLAVASCVVTIFAQQEALQSFNKFSLPLRMGNALISCAAYLDQMFWPSGLAVLYPLTSGSVGVSGVVLSLVLLAGISTGVFILRRRHPYFLTGWLWYLIMLMPVIGIIQVGGQARADRYTYLPQIGLYLLLTWALAELCAGWRHRRVVLGGGSAIILAVLMICTYEQTSYWRNSESLWTHTLACTSDNDVAHDNFGNFLIGEGRADEAITHYQKAVQINPKNVEAHYNLGNVLIKEGSVDEAITYYQKALQINPDYAQAHNNLGNALLQKGNVDEAIVHFQKALQISPHFAEAHYNFGNVLFHKGRVDEAITHFQTALQIRPDNAEAHYNFGNVLIKAGRVDEAIVQYQQALQINPDSLDFLNNLAWLLATYPDAHIRNGAQAVKYAGRACELTHDGVTLLVGTLAAAYAEAGRYDDAIATAQEACALASASGEQDLLEKNQKLLALYRAHQPYHETAEKFVPAAP
jgi:tetratricopeptide (TPR) repeat protein